MTQPINSETQVEPHILEFTGFEKCEHEPSANDPCEKCGAKNQQLYFGNVNYWDCREGDYWCAKCVRELFEANSNPEEWEMEPIEDGSA